MVLSSVCQLKVVCRIVHSAKKYTITLLLSMPIAALFYLRQNFKLQ